MPCSGCIMMMLKLAYSIRHCAVGSARHHVACRMLVGNASDSQTYVLNAQALYIMLASPAGTIYCYGYLWPVHIKASCMLRHSAACTPAAAIGGVLYTWQFGSSTIVTTGD